MGRGDAAGQHVLYVAYELPTFSDFVARHNSHLVEMGESETKISYNSRGAGAIVVRIDPAR